jgi:hypothetical protein
MDALEEAARIAEARFRELALSVVAGDPITGDLQWLNNSLTAGEQALVGYAFGFYDPATDMITLAGVQYEGKVYIVGSVIQSSVPAQGSSKTEHITSYALDVAEPMTFDVFCFIASGSVSLLTIGGSQGNRIVGMLSDEFQALTFVVSKIFEDVMTVSPGVSVADISSFIIRKG